MAEIDNEHIARVVRARSDLFEQHFAAGDAAGLVADYYVASPRMSAPDALLFRDRETLVGVFGGFVKDFAACRLVQHIVRSSGNLAYEVGSAFLEPKGGGAAIECRYMIAWRECEDTWRVEMDFFAFGKLL